MRKAILLILLLAGALSAQPRQNIAWITMDSTAITMRKDAKDTTDVYVMFRVDGRTTLGTSFTWSSDAAQWDGNGSVWIWPDTIGTATEMDSLICVIQTCDNRGNVASGPLAYLNFHNTIAQWDTTARWLDYTPATWYSASVGGFAGPCYGLRLRFVQRAESAADSLLMPVKFIRE